MSDLFHSLGTWTDSLTSSSLEGAERAKEAKARRARKEVRILTLQRGEGRVEGRGREKREDPREREKFGERELRSFFRRSYIRICYRNSLLILFR